MAEIVEAVGEGGNQQNNIAASATIENILEEKIEKKEEQILKLEASVFQLANYYFVFQGVILTAIIKGSSGGLKCQHFLLPFFLSLVGAVLNFGSLFIIAYKYKESLDQLDKRNLTLYKRLYPVKQEEEHHEMSEKHKKKKKELHTMSEKRKKKKTWRLAVMVASMILFFIFACLNLVATWLIPCRS